MRVDLEAWNTEYAKRTQTEREKARLVEAIEGICNTCAAWAALNPSDETKQLLDAIKRRVMEVNDLRPDDEPEYHCHGFGSGYYYRCDDEACPGPVDAL